MKGNESLIQRIEINIAMVRVYSSGWGFVFVGDE